MMKIDEIRQQTDAELGALLDEVKRELFDLNMSKSLGQLEHPDQIRKLRRQVARFETVRTERRQGVVAPGSEAARKAASEAAAAAAAAKPVKSDESEAPAAEATTEPSAPAEAPVEEES